jgi:NADH-quinone oxidoreductase subunit E
MIALNNTYHENMTIEKLENIIKGCRKWVQTTWL